MCHRRLVSRIGFMLVASCWVSLALIGCSQEEHLEADPGVSPFYPAPSAPNTVAKGAETGAAPAERRSSASAGRESTTAVVPGDSARIDARFGTNEVERQLRVALRTAQKDPAVAADLLDKVLAIEPINREALLGRASLALKQANAAPAIDDQAAAVDKAVALVRSLMRAYDSLKPHEVDFLKRAFYAKAKVLAQRQQIDAAIAALKEMNDMGLDPFARMENDESMTALRALPQYKAALKADNEMRLGLARQRTNGLPLPEKEIPFHFTLSDFNGEKVSLSNFKGKVVVVDLWGTWCAPCREAIPGLASLYRRWHSQGLEVIGLSYEKEEGTASQMQEMVKAFVREAGIPYVCLSGDTDTLKQVPGWKGFPTTVIVDRLGRVRFIFTENNSTTMDAIGDIVRILLAETDAKPAAPQSNAAAKDSASKPDAAAKHPTPKPDAAAKGSIPKPSADVKKP